MRKSWLVVLAGSMLLFTGAARAQSMGGASTFNWTQTNVPVWVSYDLDNGVGLCTNKARDYCNSGEGRARFVCLHGIRYVAEPADVSATWRRTITSVLDGVDISYYDCSATCIAACNSASTQLQPYKPTCGGGAGCTPIVLDLDADGYRFTSLANPVEFDLDADGTSDRVTWTAATARDAFLVFDWNSNGQIDDGSELFGGVTPQPPSASPNGFVALSVFDTPDFGGDSNGWIAEGDAIFSLLQLWVDENHDGRAEPHELSDLATSEIAGISLRVIETGRRDRWGNELHWASKVAFRDGRRRWAAVDVIFQKSAAQ